MEINNTRLKDHYGTCKGKIVLLVAPYWSPLIPPQGIGALKSYLEKKGYSVLGVDLNVEDDIKEVYREYFEKLKRFVPESNWGNFYNIGHDVLQDHIAAHFKYLDYCKDLNRYKGLVKELVHKTYYSQIDDLQVGELIQIMEKFYEYMGQHIERLLATEQPDVVGLTVWRGNISGAIYIAKTVKNINPTIKTVMGGGAFSESHTMGSPNFDALLNETKEYLNKIFVIGQGEIAFLKYLEGELADTQRIYIKEDINSEFLSFEELETADLSDFKLEYYPYIAATASTSCPHHCSFCNAAKFWGEYKPKNSALVVKEMNKQYEKYKKQLFFMTDSLLNPVVTDLAKELIKKGMSFYYDCYFRIDEPSGETENTLLWRQGGLYRVRLGVESGSQKILDLMDKKITVDQIRRSISSLANAGIKTTTYWVIGHPGETEEDFKMTLDLLEELKDDIYQAECNPFHYHYSGQTNSDDWAAMRKPLYPEEYDDLLIFKTWTLECEPLREETYHRMYRFVEHCKNLGIPNPYTISEIYEADRRWKMLHQHAVPSVVEFSKDKYLIESKKLKSFTMAKSCLEDDEDFNF